MVHTLPVTVTACDTRQQLRTQSAPGCLPNSAGVQSDSESVRVTVTAAPAASVSIMILLPPPPLPQPLSLQCQPPTTATFTLCRLSSLTYLMSLPSFPLVQHNLSRSDCIPPLRCVPIPGTPLCRLGGHFPSVRPPVA
eukprot:2652172-Rhodomonas_salina.2